MQGRLQASLSTVSVAMVGFWAPVCGLACEPCATTLDTSASIERADLIIVGQRTDYSVSETQLSVGGPDTVRVKILDVLKGHPAQQNEVVVNAWDGMCDYGIVVDDRPHVMFLQQRGAIYDAVDYGCGLKALLVENGGVDVDGHRITLETFASMASPNTKE